MGMETQLCYVAGPETIMRLAHRMNINLIKDKLPMAEICTSNVSPKHGELKQSARRGKGWGSPPIHAVCQSLVVL